MAINPTVRSFFADRLAQELRRRLPEAGTPRFLRDDLSTLFEQAVRGRKRLRATEEDALLEQITGNNKAIYSLCLYFLENNKHDDARSLGEKLGNTEYGYLIRAAIAADRRQLPNAIENLQKAIERQQRLSRSWFCLGLAFAASGNTARAIYHLYRAIRTNPSNDALYDDIVNILRPDDSRRSLITQLKERAPQERHRWIEPLDAFFSEPEPTEAEQPSDTQRDELGRVGGPDYLPPLASIYRVLRDLEEGSDTLDSAITVDAHDFLKAKTAAHRAQLAASLYRTARSSLDREQARWLGSYAFARAASVAGEEKNHYLLTFLVCSYYCNTDETVRDVAFRHYVAGAGSRLLKPDPLQAIQLFVREPAASGTIWAARLVVGLPGEFVSSGRPKLSHRDRVKLGLAFVLNPDESDSSKLHALSVLMGRAWSSSEADLVTFALSSISRILSLPQQRDRLTSIVDIKEFVARVDVRILPTFFVEILNRAISDLEHEVARNLRQQAPPIRLAAEVDVTPGGSAIATLVITNEGNVELRNIEASAAADPGVARHLVTRVESLSSGERVTTTDVQIPQKPGAEIVWKVQVNGTSLGSQFTHADSFVLRVPEPGLVFEPLDNPYLTGMPIPPGNEMFFGRQQELVQLTNLLTASRSAHVPLVFGQRRTGKTSLLNRLSVQPAIKKSYDYLLLDCERAAGSDTVGFVRFIVEEMSFGFSDASISAPSWDELSADPLGTLRSTLNKYATRFRGRRALIAMDEFETLLGGIRDNKITADILGVLRSFMQHHNAYAFIIAGADQLVERARDYASPLFGLTKPIRISYLGQDDVKELMTRPMRKLVSPDENVVSEIMSLCNGHPYLSQLLCHYVIDHLNQFGRRRLTAIDVDRAADIIITNDDAYFHEIFNDRCSKHDRIVLSAIADLAQRQSHRVAYDAVYQLLKAYDYSLTPEHLESLQDRQLIEIDAQSRTCVFGLEMLRRWIVRKHPFEAQRRSSVY